MTLKPGDVITTVEQLKALPKNTILKLKDKENGYVDVGRVMASSFLGKGVPIIETLDSLWSLPVYAACVDTYTITVLDIPKYEWKVGDMVETWEQTRKLPEYTVLASVKCCDGIWVKILWDDGSNAWKTTHPTLWADEEKPIPADCLPLQILRLGKE